MVFIRRDDSAGSWSGSLTVGDLARRIYIPTTATSPAGLVQANAVDPWNKSQKYGLGWTYFCLALVVAVAFVRAYHLWTDKLRQAMHKHEVAIEVARHYEQETENSVGHSAGTDQVYFPADVEKPYVLTRGQSHWSSIATINDTLALFRWIFYRPIPDLRFKKTVLTSFPSLAMFAVLFIALSFVTLYCFLQQPLYWKSIQYGSPPLAIRAGMIAVAMTPWVVATASKSNVITWLTGIGHDRLGVFHRWGAYLLLFSALLHMVPFYIQPVWKDGGMVVFAKLFPPGSGIIYGSGIACIVPLGWLCLGSLPFIRSWTYELFVILHIPAGYIYVGVLFWHTKNSLGSWGYLFATLAIWLVTYVVRIGNLNWAKPWRNAWLIGDEAAITLMAENAIKITIPTQMKWRPGQHVYLRMPGISVFENHPFTISSLCSEDFPSEYGDLYRDCILVFRPFGGFTKKVLETAIAKGPLKTYRAYLDGPYGGMQRELAAFDTVILFAGGSGITAIVSQLLNLIKRMRDGKAVTQKIVVIWALKRLEAMDWFREELRICREFAPPDTLSCQFYVTTAKRQIRGMENSRAPRPLSTAFHDRLDGFVAGIASKRNSAMIRDEAQGDEARERELREEDQDAITSLPQPKHLQPYGFPAPPKHPGPPQTYFPPPPTQASILKKEKEASAKRNPIARFLTPDTHETTRKFLRPIARLSPISIAALHPPEPEFHFPPSPRRDVPQFQFVPPNVSPAHAPYPSHLSPETEPYNPQDYPEQPHEEFRHSYVSSAGSHLSTQFRPPTPPLKDGTSPKADYDYDLKDPQNPLHPQPDYDYDQKHPDDPRHPQYEPDRIEISQPQPIHPDHQHLQAPKPAHVRPTNNLPPLDIPENSLRNAGQAPNFDFGFPQTPTLFQKNLMKISFAPPLPKPGGWTTEYGRPDLGYTLKEMATGGPDGKGIFGRRTAVFVCGPPSMRVDVAMAVARLQTDIWGDGERDEVFLWTENYAV